MSALLEGRARGPIAARSAKISDCYRSGGQSGAAIAAEDDVLAYLLARLPATYAAVAASLREVRARSDFAPKSLTDIGAGPGTASWAAVETWPALERIAMIDSSAVFLDMARKLAAASASPALATAATTLGDVTRLSDLQSSDLVIASYALAEMPDALENIAMTLWKSCAGVLVLVEPGTPAGYERIVACRSALIADGARIIAPCPHAAACPIVAPDWCHFSRRLPRSRDHMIVKAANVPFEDEKFSYLAIARDHVAVEGYEARVLAPPKKDKTGIAMKLCANGEISQRKIPRRDRKAFSQARDSRWGDSL